jgi:Cu2+-exporting ATPase
MIDVTAGHVAHVTPREHGDLSAHKRRQHRGHHDHAAMVADFQRRFWISLVLTVPVLALSPMLQRAF